ncbi:MAG: hypothetical protein OXC48_09145, partial [Endozoicomonadaceae bacterium]|nr:hypothetical protein [Endozoicomonadaceae bacterium]
GYRHASYDDIPKSVLAKSKDGSGGDGSKLTLRISKGNDPRLILKSDPWSALKVVVYMRANGTPILVFYGTNPKSRPATIKSDLIAGALGIKDSAFQDADRLVAAFIKQFGKVEVIGHSLGGGIAQYAGIKNNSKVTTFNSMALHINLRNRLGQKINNADVTNINTSSDVLSQTIESKFWIFKMIAQVGKCYVIPDSGGHRMKDVVKGMKKLLGDKWQ